MESTFTQEKINYIHSLLDKELLKLKKPEKSSNPEEILGKQSSNSKKIEERENVALAPEKKTFREEERDYNNFEEEIFGLQSKISDLEKRFSYLGSPQSNRGESKNFQASFFNEVNI
jgi:hypothetical protein